MPDIERVIFSFCSKRMKPMTVSRGVRPFNFLVTIGKNCEVFYLRTQRHVIWNLNYYTGEEGVRVGPLMNGREKPIIWDQPGWSMAERFNHVCDLFPDLKTDYLSFYSDRFDLNLLPLFRFLDVYELSLPGIMKNSSFNVELLNYFKKVDKIVLDCPRFDSNTQVASILTRYLHTLSITINFDINFEELLLINSRYVYLANQDLTAKHINMFLKIWMRGSNPQLRSFIFFFDGWTELEDLDCILTGKNFQILPDTKESQYVDSDGHIVTIHGGLEIRNKDGIRAIVEFKKDDSEIEFIVIDD
ncbi:hypothetical protein CAEBREN_30883 [Caenorhabditis brenneri]|uniref:Sdz-33 F-box domain-containing protein n=1 Tax=Caenorhabditis brenneri TaxID=135651 RepID=G0MB81_CAEBE|nr:hypothetical protein CAEBREN_30883 [Caenorhabditis brenneri]